MHPIDLAGLQRRRSGRAIGHDEVLDPIDIHSLAAGVEVGRLVARHVFVVLHPDGTRAGDPVVLDELERTGTRWSR